MNKKGITPLMATLLLVSFAVALGVIIMNFGRAQVELEAQCPIAINLQLSEIDGQKQFCLNAAKKEISFTVENGVNIKVNGLIVNIIGSERAETVNLNQAIIDKAGVYLGRVPAAGVGEIQQVKITPKVVLYDAEQICTEKALVVEKIRDC